MLRLENAEVVAVNDCVWTLGPWHYLCFAVKDGKTACSPYGYVIICLIVIDSS